MILITDLPGDLVLVPGAGPHRSLETTLQDSLHRLLEVQVRGQHSSVGQVLSYEGTCHKS